MEWFRLNEIFPPPSMHKFLKFQKEKIEKDYMNGTTHRIHKARNKKIR